MKITFERKDLKPQSKDKAFSEVTIKDIEPCYAHDVLLSDTCYFLDGGRSRKLECVTLENIDEHWKKEAEAMRRADPSFAGLKGDTLTPAEVDFAKAKEITIRPGIFLPNPKPPTPSRYRWTYNGVTFDYYRLCDILGLKSDPQKHALKKVIRAGQSVKPLKQDIDEAIDALKRWKEMVEEDETATRLTP